MEKNNRLRERRLELRLTQKDVAKKCGITDGYYSMVENGKEKPSLEMAIKIAKALQSGVDALFVVKR